MMVLATISLCALGHLVRDGWPILGSTHAARALGGFFCVLGGFLLTWDYTGALMGLALYMGFYADMEHGEGQRTRGWMDVPYLAVSGVTSLLPLAAASWWLYGPWFALVALAGLLKPPVWFAAWRTVPIDWQPTRIAAVTWGALCGGLIGLVNAI